jgi:hypothetical protein
MAVIITVTRQGSTAAGAADFMVEADSMVVEADSMVAEDGANYRLEAALKRETREFLASRFAFLSRFYSFTLIFNRNFTPRVSYSGGRENA